MESLVISPFAKEAALALLQIGAVTLRPQEPYIWASGIKSPMYCDNRLTLSYPPLRSRIANWLTECIYQYGANIECVAGTATAGIAHAALAADRLRLPMVYVRSSAKDHGKKNLVEGRLLPNQQVVVVEDTVSTGGSVISAINGLREEGAIVSFALAIFTYGFAETEQAFLQAGVPLIAVTDFRTLVDVAAQHGYLQNEDVSTLLRFREDPHSYGIAR